MHIPHSHSLLVAGLLTLSSNAFAAPTFGAYVYGLSLGPPIGPPGAPHSDSDGGVGSTSASISEIGFKAEASLGGSTFTPILRASSVSSGVSTLDELADAEAEAFQTYTSSITQTITLDVHLHAISMEEGTAFSYTDISSNIIVKGGSDFAIQDTFCHGGLRAFDSIYLCGSTLGSSGLYGGGGSGTVSLFDTVAFDVVAGERFAVYGSLSAFSIDGSANAFDTLTMSFTDDTHISAVSAIPVPAAVWLFGSGLIGLIGIARRRQHI